MYSMTFLREREGERETERERGREREVNNIIDIQINKHQLSNSFFDLIAGNIKLHVM